MLGVLSLLSTEGHFGAVFLDGGLDLFDYLRKLFYGRATFFGVSTGAVVLPELDCDSLGTLEGLVLGASGDDGVLDDLGDVLSDEVSDGFGDGLTSSGGRLVESNCGGVPDEDSRGERFHVVCFNYYKFDCVILILQADNRTIIKFKFFKCTLRNFYAH